jgi:pimeloyl-ACP methyl ester carboxylesterase
MGKMNIKNDKYLGSHNRLSLIDLTIPESYSGKLVLFVHGFMGFKDWGAWNKVEAYFLKLGFGFCKYNVSHNGCSISEPFNFVDLSAFAENNYSKEKVDLHLVLNWLGQKLKPMPEIYVVGHSRGGGIALLSGNDPRIKKIATWAAISDIESRFPMNEDLDKWKTDGVRFQKNGRTNQNMPINYSQYEDFLRNKEELDIKQSVENNIKPLLLIHGDGDTSVPLFEGQNLQKWSGKELQIIQNANHTFGSSHPWENEDMPQDLKKVCTLTAEFFLSSNK